MLTLKTYLRATRKDKQGLSIIYFIVADEWISTGLKVNAEYWCSVQSFFTSAKAPQYNNIAPQLLLLRSRAESCIANFNIDNKPFNRKYFEEYIFEGREAAENPCFLKLIDAYCSEKSIGYERQKHYITLKDDIKYILLRPKVKDINFKFYNSFNRYLVSKGNNENTIIRKIKMLKALVHFAQELGIIKDDPLKAVKLKQIKGNKNFLTEGELLILSDLYYSGTLNQSYQNVLQYFLFSCYTALRFSDVQKLQYSDIKNDTVTTTQEKTNKPVTVPLIPQALKLLTINQVGKCFRVLQNQPTNRTLKSIVEMAGIDKKITYHCSRHTFATLSITFGIPLEVVADLMGVDDKTVRVYAQIVKDLKAQEMQKWNRVAV